MIRAESAIEEETEVNICQAGVISDPLSTATTSLGVLENSSISMIIGEPETIELSTNDSTIVSLLTLRQTPGFELDFITISNDV